LDTQRIIVAASILASDFTNIRGEVERLEAGGADWFHLDIMDGHFVDNISFGPAMVAAVRKCTALPIDVHLMIEHPEHYLGRFKGVADNITIHVEAAQDAARTLREIREAGQTAGLAISPDTAFERAEPYLDQIDLLLVMTVRPGFGGQKFMPETLGKVSAAAEWKRRHSRDFHIEVDGGINAETARPAVRNGAGVLVAGTYVCGAPDAQEAIRSLHDAI